MNIARPPVQKKRLASVHLTAKLRREINPVSPNEWSREYFCTKHVNSVGTPSIANHLHLQHSAAFKNRN